MSRRRAIDTESFSLSFLDVICCGFGAIIILLVLTKIGEPAALERAVRDLDGLVAKLQEELHEIRGESRRLERELVGSASSQSAQIGLPSSSPSASSGGSEPSQSLSRLSLCSGAPG